MKWKYAVSTFAMLCLFSLCASAQSTVADHRFEVGAHVTAIDLSPVETLIDSPIGPLRVEGLDVTTKGFGGRFGYNVNDYLGVEAEVNYLPKKNFNEVFQSRRTQVFAGVKVGARGDKVGVFVKARPGAMHFSEVPFHTVCGQNPNSFSCQEMSQTNFALDIGGIVEFYPSSRFIVRIDAGDTIINFPESGPTNLVNSTAFTPGATTHNLQIGIGFGYRF